MAQENAVSPTLNTSPIKSIPAEILSEILIYAEKNQGGYEEYPSTIQSISTCVSRQFRDTALSTGQLWNAFQITCSATRLEKVAMFLQRSSQCPLTISINLNEEWFRDWKQQSENTSVDLAIIDAVLAEASRLSDLTVFYGTRSSNLLTGFAARASSLMTPALTSFRAVIGGEPYESEEDTDDDSEEESYPSSSLATRPRVLHPTIFLAGTPCLTSLCMTPVALHLFLPPMNHITSLTLESPHYNCYLDMNPPQPWIHPSELASLVSLITLSMNMDSFHCGEPGQSTTKTLNLLTLQSLAITGFICHEFDHAYTYEWPTAQVSMLLMSTSAPNLTSLTIEMPTHIENGDDALYLSTLTPLVKFPNLRSLTLRDFFCQPEAFRRVVRAVPTVEILNIDATCDNEDCSWWMVVDTLERLRGHHSVTPVLPMLQTCTFRNLSIECIEGPQQYVNEPHTASNRTLQLMDAIEDARGHHIDFSLTPNQYQHTGVFNGITLKEWRQNHCQTRSACADCFLVEGAPPFEHPFYWDCGCPELEFAVPDKKEI